METNEIIRVCGSVIKTESIVLLSDHILEKTVVAEADSPYLKYYGAIPEQPAPNSLFLFTRVFYTLEEVLRLTQQIDSCYTKGINVATSVLDFGHQCYPAIRVKNFPDYKHLKDLQQCFFKLGVQFAKRIKVAEYAKVKTNKCFKIKKLSEDIFFDLEEKDKGYVLLQQLLTEDQFQELVTQTRNNGNCRLFDAAKCGIILDSEVKELIRIFSEKLDIELLQCIRQEFYSIQDKKFHTFKSNVSN